MSRFPVIITPRFIRRYNLRCLGRSLLAACGAGAVFFVVFVFAWLMVSLVTGRKDLDLPVILFASLFSLVVYGFGFRHLARHGPQDWERVARKPDRKPGMRLSRMSNQEYGQIGMGFLGLVLAGPVWLSRMVAEWKAMMPTDEDFARELETLRQHVAARDAWVPMEHFQKYEADLYRLAQLNVVAVRELLGQWHFHVTVEGTVKRSEGPPRGEPS